MRDEFTVHVEIILARRYAQGRHIDGYMQDAEESEREHCWDRVHERGPVNSRKIYE